MIFENACVMYCIPKHISFSFEELLLAFGVCLLVTLYEICTDEDTAGKPEVVWHVPPLRSPWDRLLL